MSPDKPRFAKHEVALTEAQEIVRLVSSEDYTRSFGFQWNRFEKTQLDRLEKGQLQSKTRLFAETGWPENGLEGEKILEVGSGAGRFTKVLLEFTKAEVYSIDYSSAVEANLRNNGHFGQRLKLYQASLYELPFSPATFDRVLCIGVLQHTPDFRKSIKCLAGMVKPGGELVVDFYPVKGWWTKIHAKYILRPLTRRLSGKRLLRLIEKNIGWLIAAYRFFDRLGVGRVINRFLPVCDIKNTIPNGLSEQELREWAILDTFDMFSPAYDHPQRVRDVVEMVRECGLSVGFAGFVRFDNNVAAVVRANRK